MYVTNVNDVNWLLSDRHDSDDWWVDWRCWEWQTLYAAGGKDAVHLQMLHVEHNLPYSVLQPQTGS